MTVYPVINAYLCSGCGACTVICPKKAISMCKTSIGRLTACVDEAKCTNCCLCCDVCPSIDSTNSVLPKEQDYYVGSIIRVLTGISTNDLIYRNSQSGGAVTEIISYLFDTAQIEAAIVCRAEYATPSVNVHPVVVTCKEDLLSTQRSQYTPVDMVSALRGTENFKAIAFVGLPCHLQGVDALLLKSNRHSNVIYKIGLVCDRTESEAFSRCLTEDYISDKKFRLIARKKHFAYKQQYYPYRIAPVVMEYEDGSMDVISNQKRFLLKDTFTSPRCQLCFDKLNTHADIVCGDPWGMSHIDWKRGESLVITRTKKGDQLIQDMQQANRLRLVKAFPEEMLKGQRIEKRKYSVGESIAAYRGLNFGELPVYFNQLLTASYSPYSSTRSQDMESYISLEKMPIEQIIQIVNDKVNEKSTMSSLKSSIIKNVKLLLKKKENEHPFTILIDRTNTFNKGAELMLYAILQEIERVHPDAKVIFPNQGLPEGVSYIKTNVNLQRRKGYQLLRILNKLRVFLILRRLGVKTYYNLRYPVKNVDVVLDAAGFAYSDLWNSSDDTVSMFENYCKKMKAYGTKFVFLPQAAGPFETKNGKRSAEIINKYADLFMPREQISYDYCLKAGITPAKLRLFTDFTSLVKGEFPQGREYLKGRVAIIPNMRMIDKGAINAEHYLDFLVEVISACEMSGKKVYLLNHEGKRDEDICHVINKRLGTHQLPIATRLTALEVKGLIAESYLVVTSRFHGVASALNSCVPCLATSWSHKYAMLFNDYILTDEILDYNNKDNSMLKIKSYLDTDVNRKLRIHLSNQKDRIASETKHMWDCIWLEVKR